MNKNLIAGFFALLVLTGCASGSALVIGTPRAPTDPLSVKIYTTPPPTFDEIAIVKASSDSGWTQQGDLDYALQEPKKQAAKVGANGVLLTATGTQTGVASVPVYGGGTIIGTTEKQVLEGRAIFVTEK
jgi:hypothetical protein